MFGKINQSYNSPYCNIQQIQLCVYRNSLTSKYFFKKMADGCIRFAIVFEWEFMTNKVLNNILTRTQNGFEGGGETPKH